MLGIDHPPGLVDDVIVPPSAHGVRLVSMGFFARDDQAVIWRGPMLHKALEQFLTDVHWGDPDVLVVDLPPGTGDVALSMAQLLPHAEVMVVTTPQPAAQRVARAQRGDGREGEPPGHRRHREHVVVHRRRREALRDLRRRRRPGAGRHARRARCSARSRSSRRCGRAATAGRPIMVTDPDSDAAQAFTAIARASRRRRAPPDPSPRAADRLTDASRPPRPAGSVPDMDVRIGVHLSPKELDLEVETGDVAQLEIVVNDALNGEGRSSGSPTCTAVASAVPAERLAYVEIDDDGNGKRVGFGPG